MLRRALVPLALLLPPTLVGCSLVDAATYEAPTYEAPEQTLAERYPGRWVSLEGMPLRFRLPQGWRTFDPSDVPGIRSGSNAASRKIVAKTAMTNQTFADLVRRTELLAVAPRFNFLQLNFVEVHDDGPGRLPSEEVARRHLDRRNRIMGTYTRTTTALGAAVRVTFTFNNAAYAQHSEMLAVRFRKRVLYIFVTTSRDSDTADLTDMIAATLRPAR